MKCPRGTHKRTESERYAALATTSGAGLSRINPSLFCVIRWRKEARPVIVGREGM